MNQNKAILVLAGATLTMGSCYTPVQKPQPSAEVISKYINNDYRPDKCNVINVIAHKKGSIYCKGLGKISINRWMASEARKKELLTDIRGIRAQIREKAKQLAISENIQSYEELLEDREVDLNASSEHLVIEIAGIMHTKTCHHIHQVMTARAEEIKVPRKYLSESTVLGRKGIVVVDMSHII